MIVKGGKIFYSLREIAPSSPYSADYLRIRAVQRKLRGIKIGREWYTTKDWLDEYVLRYAIKSIQERAIGPIESRLPRAAVPSRVTVPYGLEPGRVPYAAQGGAVVPTPHGRLRGFVRRVGDSRLFRTLTAPVPPKLFLAPLVIALAFLVVYPVAASLPEWRARVAAVADQVGSFLIEVAVPDVRAVAGEFSVYSMRAARSLANGVGAFFIEVEVPRPETIPGRLTEALVRAGDQVVSAPAFALADRVGSFLIEVRAPRRDELPSLAYIAGDQALAVVAASVEHSFSRFTHAAASLARALDAVGVSTTRLSASVFDSYRVLFSSLVARFEFPERIQRLLGLILPSPPPMVAPSTYAEASPSPASTAAGEITIRRREVVAVEREVREEREVVTREVVRPADVSAFEQRLEDLNRGLRSTVNKLVSDVATLFTALDQKTSIVTSFAPSQSIGRLANMKFFGFSDFQGDVEIAGNLRVVGSCSGCGGGGSGTINSGTLSRLAYYSAATTLDSANFLTVDATNSLFGIGTSSPYAMLSVAGNIVANNIIATSTAVFSGIGTTSPTTLLGVGGPILYGSTGATSTNVGSEHIKQNLSVFGNLQVLGACQGCGGSGAINAGTVNRLPYYSDTTTLDSVNFLAVNPQASLFGIGTTSPWGLLSVEATASVGSSTPIFVVSDTGTTTPFLLVSGSNGFVGLGTTSPYARLSVVGETISSFFTATSTTASTFAGGLGIGTSSPGALFAVHGPALINGTTTIIGGLLTPSISATSSLGFYTGGAAAPRVLIDSSGNVGIGTTSPGAKLTVVDGSILASGTTGDIPLVGPGTRLMWVPSRAAFRAGRVQGTQWNTLGLYSAAFGDNNTVSSDYSFAAGNNNTVSGGQFAVAFGRNNTVSQDGAAAFGTDNTSSGLYSTAFGDSNTASGDWSFTIGRGNTASFDYAIAMGRNVTVSGGNSIGIGLDSTARTVSAGNVMAILGGNLGIGTTTPGVLFSVHGPALIMGTTTSIGGLLTPSISATGTLGIYTGGAALPRILLDSNGNLGLGTTSPGTLLAVQGQCVTGDTRLRRRRRRKLGRGSTLKSYEVEPREISGDGYLYDEVMIKDVTPGDEILSLNENTGQLEYQPVVALLAMGVKPVYRLTTAGGRTIRTTANHPYLTRYGWAKVASLAVGDEIAVPKEEALALSRLGVVEERDAKDGERYGNRNNVERRERQVHTRLLSMAHRPHKDNDTDDADGEVRKDEWVNGHVQGVGVEERVTPMMRKATALASPAMNAVAVTMALPAGTKYATTVEATRILETSAKYRARSSIWSLFSRMSSWYQGSGDGVKWDAITAIEYAGFEPVWDIEVEGTHNFIANDIVAHNTYIHGTTTIQGGLLTPSISATSSLGFYTGGAAAPRMVIDSSGNVGIGTTSPGSLLSVHNGSLDVGGVATIENNIKTGYVTATSSTASFLNFASSTSYSLSNLLNVSGLGTSTFSGSLLTGTTAGSFGIGTSSPGDFTASIAGRLLYGSTGATSTNIGAQLINGALSVKGPAEFLSGIQTPGLNVTGSGTTTFSGGVQAVGLASSNGLRVSSGDTILAGGLQSAGVLNITGTATSTYSGGISISTSGGLSSQSGLTLTGGSLLASNIGALLGTTTLNSALAALGGPGAPAYSFSADTNTGFYSSGADTLNFTTAGLERVRIDSSGNLGIGTTSPGSLFAVHGPVLINGTNILCAAME